jgi:hypothetical protein
MLRCWLTRIQEVILYWLDSFNPHLLYKGNILISDTNYIWRLHQQNVTKDFWYAHNLEEKEKNKGPATLIIFPPRCTQTTIKDNTCNHWRSLTRAKPGHGPPCPGEETIFIPIRPCVKPTKDTQTSRYESRTYVVAFFYSSSWHHPWRYAPS